jgi:hypothetical protein
VSPATTVYVEVEPPLEDEPPVLVLVVSETSVAVAVCAEALEVPATAALVLATAAVVLGAWVEPIVAAEASVGIAMPVIAAAQSVTVRTCLRAGAEMDRRLNDKTQTLPLQAAYRVS